MQDDLNLAEKAVCIVAKDLLNSLFICGKACLSSGDRPIYRRYDEIGLQFYVTIK